MKMIKTRKGFTLGDAPVLVLSFGLVILISAAISVAVSSFQATQTSGTVSYNVSTQGLNGLLNFGTQMPTVGTVLGVSLIIGIVIAAFSFGRGNSGL